MRTINHKGVTIYVLHPAKVAVYDGYRYRFFYCIAAAKEYIKCHLKPWTMPPTAWLFCFCWSFSSALHGFIYQNNRTVPSVPKSIVENYLRIYTVVKRLQFQAFQNQMCSDCVVPSSKGSKRRILELSRNFWNCAIFCTQCVRIYTKYPVPSVPFQDLACSSLVWIVEGWNLELHVFGCRNRRNYFLLIFWAVFKVIFYLLLYI